MVVVVESVEGGKGGGKRKGREERRGEGEKRMGGEKRREEREGRILTMGSWTAKSG